MPNPFGAPEISVQAVEAKRKAGEQFVWLDVREPNELAQVAIADERVVNVPLSDLSSRQLNALPAAAQDKEAEIIAFCHHGMRSAQVTAWLRQQGWTNVINMTGGIDAWAQAIDPTIGMY
ncbi:MAG: rhodanese-like domain-containing protein [Chloroflexi bacterium]|nr:rhodanese-like domain-containing protein [Chloroflexota bacterium]